MTSPTPDGGETVTGPVDVGSNSTANANNSNINNNDEDAMGSSSSAAAAAAVSSSNNGYGNGHHQLPPPTADDEAVEVKLFVGKVPQSRKDEDVYNLFSKWGPVREAVVLLDRGSERPHKGSAFVRMRISDADRAIRESRADPSMAMMSDSTEPVTIRYAVNECKRLGIEPESEGVDIAKLFVGSLSPHTTQEQVREIFRDYASIEEIYLIGQQKESGTCSGCAFVNLSKEDALLAIRRLDSQITAPGSTRKIQVRFADKKKAVGGGGGAGGGVGGMQQHHQQFQQQQHHPHLQQHHQHQQHAQQAMMLGGPGGMMMHPALAAMYGGGAPGVAYGAAAAASYPPMVVGLWERHFDKDTQKFYYYNTKTKETTWNAPFEFSQVPDPVQPQQFDSMGGMSQRTHTVGPPGANLFIYQVPDDLDEDGLAQLFERFGPIQSCTIVVSKEQPRRRKGYGFVSFQSVADAAKALQETKGTMMTSSNRVMRISVKSREDKHIRPFLDAATAATLPSEQPGNGGGGGGGGGASLTPYGSYGGMGAGPVQSMPAQGAGYGGMYGGGGAYGMPQQQATGANRCTPY